MHYEFCIGIFIIYLSVQILSYGNSTTKARVIVKAEEEYTFQVNNLIQLYL